MKTKTIKCKCCQERGTPKNNSTIGYYCEKEACQAEKKKSGIKRVNKKFNKQQIRKVSIKLSKEQAVYRGKRIIFLAENTNCFAKFNGCFGEATDVHHSRGRGRYLNDTTTWLPLCRSCHNYIETHPKEAKQKGYSKDRL